MKKKVEHTKQLIPFADNELVLQLKTTITTLLVLTVVNATIKSSVVIITFTNKRWVYKGSCSNCCNVLLPK